MTSLKIPFRMSKSVAVTDNEVHSRLSLSCRLLDLFEQQSSYPALESDLTCEKWIASAQLTTLF